MPKLRNGSKVGDSNPGSLDCESGILLLTCNLILNDNTITGVAGIIQLWNTMMTHDPKGFNTT